MKNLLILCTFICSAALLSSAATVSRASDRHIDLHGAVERGEIVPLSQLFSYLQDRYHGNIIEIELEEDDGRLEYEIEMIGPDGQVAEFTFDAKLGILLEIEGYNIKAMEKP